MLTLSMVPESVTSTKLLSFSVYPPPVSPPATLSEDKMTPASLVTPNVPPITALSP